MECRYFDAHGNYYLKDNEVVQDTWLDGVDWNKVPFHYLALRKYTKTYMSQCNVWQLIVGLVLSIILMVRV